MKRVYSRLVSLLLAAVMLCSFVPASAASETEAAAPTIPGYTQVTALDRLFPNRKYLIVAQAPDKTCYALRLCEGSHSSNPGLNGYPQCTATLTISGNTVTAVSTADTTVSIPMTDLLLDVVQANGLYAIKNNDYSLALNAEMYGTPSAAPHLTLSFVSQGRFNIYNTPADRYLTFNVNGASSTQTQFPNLATGFCGWREAQPNYIPIYIFAASTLGSDLPEMLAGGDELGGGSTEDADPSGQKSWVFTGGAAAQGSFADIAGARTWAGHFEEYARYAKAKTLQANGTYEYQLAPLQRHVINAAYAGQTLAQIVSSFDTRIGKLKPRAVAYLVDEGGSGETGFADSLNALIDKSLALQDNTGMIVIASLSEADHTAVTNAVNARGGEGKSRILPVAFSNVEKTGGLPNASGHLTMAKQLADAVAGSSVSTAANWPYGAISGSVLADGFPNKTAVEPHHSYETPSDASLNQAQKDVRAKANDKSASMTWLFMGDSITHGSAWTGGYDSLAQLFEKFVKDDLDRVQDVVINAGSSGATTDSTLNDLNRRLVKYDPDVVVLMLGTNDSKNNTMPAETYKTNLRTLLDKILAMGAIPVLRTPPPTTDSAYFIETYAGYVREVAEEQAYADSVILVDQYARWESQNWSEVFSRDSLHPDEAGHLWFVHQLIKELALWNDSYDICQLEYVEMEDPERIVLPGYTQLTNLNALDEEKGYLIVSQDSDGGLYALYPSADGETIGAGSLPTHNGDTEGARTAQLTVTEDSVSAVWMKDDSPQDMEKLLFTIEAQEGGGYVFTAFNGRHLNMQGYMFTEGMVTLTVANRGTDAIGAFLIGNVNGSKNRYLALSKYGDPKAFGSSPTAYGTDFWCPDSAANSKLPIYLFASDTATIPTAKDNILTLKEEIAALDSGEYTRASWAALQTALTAANTALDSGEEDGDAEVYVTAYEALRSAVESLQSRPMPPTVPAGDIKKEVADLTPAGGVTTGQPFPTAGFPDGNGKTCTSFRIPSIITLQHQTGDHESKNGRLLAAADARWNIGGDACGLDTAVSYSDDGGDHWNYRFANYFGDSLNEGTYHATAFIDPVMVEAKDGTVFLMVDLWPGGLALNTAPNKTPASATGYVNIGGKDRLALYTSTENGQQSDSNYPYYVGDFDGGYAPVYAPMDGGNDVFVGFYVDEYYYLYYTAQSDFANKTPANDKIWCKQRVSTQTPTWSSGGDRDSDDTWVQQNVFFYNATLHARNASYLWLTRSTDGGETWSAPNMVNPQVRTGADMFFGVGPGAGLCMEDGTLIFPTYSWKKVNGSAVERAWFIYSTDNGVTWHRGNSATSDHSSESCLVQIDGSTIRHFYRDEGYSTLRYTDHTWDGSSWTTGSPVVTTATKTTSNQLSAIKYSQQIDGKDVILVSTATGTSVNTQNTRRHTGKIYAFLVDPDDHTMTLSDTFSVTANSVYYAYSSLAETEDGDIALLYENADTAITLRTIPFSSILHAVTAADLSVTYDGQSHGVTVGYTGTPTLTYSEDSGATWSAAEPQHTDAGTYPITVKAAWSDGTEKTAAATLTIGKASPTISITSDKGTTWNEGDEPVFTVRGVPAIGSVVLSCPEHGAIPLTKQADGTYTGTHSGVVEGNHTFTAAFTGGKNYTDFTATYQVTVVPADMELTVRAYSGTYDGKPHTIAVTAGGDVALTYCETADGDYTSALPTFTNAGVYTVYFKAVKGAQTVSNSANVTISKATPVLTVTADPGVALTTEELPLTLTVTGAPEAGQGKLTLTNSLNSRLELQKSGSGVWKSVLDLADETRTYTFVVTFDPTVNGSDEAIEHPNYERVVERVTVTVTRPDEAVEDFLFRFADDVTVDETTSTGVLRIPYDGLYHSPAAALVYDPAATIRYAVEPESGGEPNWSEQAPTYQQPGEYLVRCMAQFPGVTDSRMLYLRLSIVEEETPVTLTLTPSSATPKGGSKLTLTVGGAPDAGELTVTCGDAALTLMETARGKYTVTLPNVTRSYTFTAHYAGVGSYLPAAADCAVDVTKTSSSTGGTSSGSTTTQVKEDGTKITTVTTPAGDVTITVTDPEGEELAKVELPAEIPAPETKFEDLETVPWAEKAIHNVAGLALVKGAGNNKYEPTLPMTRGALATVLHRLSQGKSDYEVTFRDVAQGKYYTEGVAWAAKAKVVTGYTSEIFAPNDIITREQLAVMLARYAKLIGMDTTAKASSLDQFADGGDTGRWAVNGVAWCVEQGLMKGRGQNTLDPTAEISRAEVAVLLDRFLGLLK